MTTGYVYSSCYHIGTDSVARTFLMSVRLIVEDLVEPFLAWSRSVKRHRS